VVVDSVRVAADLAKVVVGSVRRVALGMVPMAYKLIQN